MRRLIVLGMAMMLMLAVPVLADEPVDWQQKYLELDVKYQQSLAKWAELNTRITQMQRDRIISEDGAASLNRKEVSAVQQRTKKPITQSRKALQDYLKSLEPEDETDSADSSM